MPQKHRVDTIGKTCISKNTGTDLNVNFKRHLTLCINYRISCTVGNMESDATEMQKLSKIAVHFWVEIYSLV